MLPVILGVFQVTYSVDSFPISTWDLSGLALGTGMLLASAIAAFEWKIVFAAALALMSFIGAIGISLRLMRHTTSEVVVEVVGLVLCGLAAAGLLVWRGRSNGGFYEKTKPWPSRGMWGLILLLFRLYER